MTQHDKIFKLHKESSDGWACGNDYRRVMIYSSHKRRAEMSQNPQYAKDYKTCHAHFGIYDFEDRKCQHDSAGVRDYRIVSTRLPTLPASMESVGKEVRMPARGRTACEKGINKL